MPRPARGGTRGVADDGTGGTEMFTLQLLHASDLEGGVDAIDNAPNFAAVVDAFEREAATQGIASILLSGGDNYIPGPFFNAGANGGLAETYEGFYNQYFGLIDISVLGASVDTNGDGFFDNDEIEAEINGSGLTVDDIYTTDVNGDGTKDFFEEIDTAPGRIDVAIMNRLGLDATAVGNHEFDAGTGGFFDAVNYESEEGNDLSAGRYGEANFLQEVDSPGIQFPYLSANLDFSRDGEIGAIFADEIRVSTDFVSDLAGARVDPADPAATGNDGRDAKAAPATIIEVDGERIGVVGATTQVVASISSTGTVDDVSNPGSNDMPALAAVLQPVIDELTAAGVDKIILTSHLQQIALETELAGLLEDVDLILAGGSDTILADATDRLRAGDTAADTYPREVTDAKGEPTLIVSTDGEYSYLGRLVVTFDENGIIDPTSVDADVSGVYATDDQGVVDVTGEATADDAIAASETASDVHKLADAVTDIVTDLDGQIAGETEVFLNGERADVRTQETNLGNLTADANLAAAKAFDPEVVVSIKNGGGIRAPIGQIVDTGGGEAELLPPAANPVSGKEAGEISELDIDNSLRFDNSLAVVELTPEELKIILEHGVAATAPGATPGQFPQVGGIQFAFDPEGTAQELGENGEVVVAGERVRTVALLGEDGTPSKPIIIEGEVVAGAPDTIKVVTLGFLATGGDGYPFSAFSLITDLDIGEQQALSKYLAANFPEDGEAAFDEADVAPAEDTRIQNLAERGDTVGDQPVDAPAASGDLVATEVAVFTGEGGEGASEVVAHEDGVLYVTNGEEDRIDIFEITGAAAPRAIDLAGLDGYDGVQSVAVKNGVVAAAIARAPNEFFGGAAVISQPGFVALFDAASGALLYTVDVGNLPDQITFTPDGSKLLVAGEGEKNEDSDHDDDPVGTVAIVDVGDPTQPTAELVDFTFLDGFEEAARAGGVRIQPGVSFGADVEPEYITVSPDGATAFVSLQENNAIAKIDIASARVLDVFGLGTRDFALSPVDPLDDGVVHLRTLDGVVGFRMPDAIAAYEADGETYVVTANEGDSRGFDEARVADLLEDGKLDGKLVAKLAAQGLIDDDEDTDIGVERLEVSTVDGDTDGDGDIDVLHAFSSRSFSIFDDEGNLVFDSGAEFEQIIAEIAPERFNDDEGEGDEDRSDAKGPEPEAVDVGEIDGRQYAFVGLERDSGIMVYDVTIPSEAFYVTYIPPKFVDSTPAGEVARHAPEVIDFISAEDSTTANAQIAVSYEVSGSTAVFDLVPAGDGGDDGGEDEAGVVINEVLASHTGADDTEFAELFGTPGASLAGLSLIAVESDATNNGEIDERIDFGESDVLGANGFYLLGNATGLDANYGVTPDQDVDPNFENSSATYALVETASLTGESVTGSEIVVDAVGSTDGDDGDSFFFDAPVLGPDGSNFPAGVRRVEDGVDTDTADDWELADFFLGDANTPTAGGVGGGNGEEPPRVTIMEIQGAGHVSPFVLEDGETVVDFFADLPADESNVTGEAVTTTGIVTAVGTDDDGSGFFLQDPNGDDDIATSDALFVITGDAPTVAVGDEVEVTAIVSEFFPGSTDTRNLPTTQLTAPLVNLLSTGNALPDATIIGQGGRIPPNQIIDDDAFAAFEPDQDGIDFFESLEGMRVTAQDTVAVAATNRFGEIFTVVDQGADATGLSGRGTLNISPDDFNPEKIQIDFTNDLFTDIDTPSVDVGALLGDVTGVVNYDFGNFQILPTEAVSVTPSTLEAETTALIDGDDQLSVASYNVLNLDPNDADGDEDVADGRFDAIAAQIVGNLGAPDIVALQEIQNNDGEVISDVAAADETLQLLVDAIAAAGGPEYVFIDTPDVPVTTDNGELIRPVGGAPGGDIRNAFLYDPNRVELVDGSVNTLLDSDGDEFPFFEGRIPLEATFAFNGEEVTLINNHFSSKGGSAPIFGVEQPFDERQEDPTVNGSLDQRQDQAQAVAERVEEILAADPDAKVSVLGDLNEFEFVSPVETILGGAGLTNLIEQLPEDERYTFIFQGNSQTLDHILASDGLIGEGAEIDIVHTNAEFASTDERASDHDPVLARFTIEETEEPADGELLVGDAGPNSLIGAQGGDILLGEGGSDILIGADGNDQLFGGEGSDNLLGGAGDDLLDGGPGTDVLMGGDGDDLFVLANPDSFDYIIDFVAGEDLVLQGVAAREDLRVVDNGSGALLQFEAAPGDFDTLASLTGGAGLTLDDVIGPEPDTII